MLILNKYRNLQKKEIYLIEENIIYKKFKKPKFPLKLFYTKRTKKLL